MSEKPISPLRQRMLEDMRLRGFTPDTQRDYIRAAKKLAACGPTKLGSLASASDGAARISAEYRQTGSDLPTRIHALPRLRLYWAE
jgi:hypothetical protein